MNFTPSPIPKPPSPHNKQKKNLGQDIAATMIDNHITLLLETNKDLSMFGFLK